MRAATLTLDDLIKRTTDLPSLPAAALAVMRETESATGSATTVARHLAQDQGLSVRVLRLANSAYYGLSRQILDVSEAVVVLGMRAVRNLCMVAATYPWLVRPLNGYSLGPGDLWRHACGSAVASQVVAEQCGGASTDSAFTAGLLHDLGKVALSVWHEDHMGAVMELAVRENLPYDAAERRVFGYDHGEVGRHIGLNWNLPLPLVEVMAHHHHPDDLVPPSRLVDSVHVGDYLATSMGLGLGGDGLRYPLSDGALERLDLTPLGFDALADLTMDRFHHHERLFEELSR